MWRRTTRSAITVACIVVIVAERVGCCIRICRSIRFCSFVGASSDPAGR
jgi:hypothetical protein